MQNLPFAAQQEQVNKFLQANKVLGAQMDQMQGTTRIIYDTVTFPTGTNPSYDFFSEVSGKSATLIQNQPATNISDNRFEPGEGMVIKELAFYNMDIQADPASPIDFDTSIAGLGLINFYVGNNRVIKDLPLFSGQATTAINNLNTTTSLTTNFSNRRYLSFRLFTNIVIPPQVQFYCNVKMPFGTGNTVNNCMEVLRLYVKGYGKLFNPRNNY